MKKNRNNSLKERERERAIERGERGWREKRGRERGGKMGREG